MTDIIPATTDAVQPRRPRQRRHIELGNDMLIPRAEFADEVLGVSERSVVRMDLPTTYLGGIAYVARAASLKIVADRIRRRNQPKKWRAA